MSDADNQGRKRERRTVVLASFLTVLMSGLGLAYLGSQAFDDPFDLLSETQALLQTPSATGETKRMASVLLPSFDAATADEKGHVVAAGRSEPGWTVQVKAKSKVLGETKADENSEWILASETSLPPGEHTLSLLEIDPTGQRTVAGERESRIIVAPPRAQAARTAASPAPKRDAPRAAVHPSELALVDPPVQETAKRDAAKAKENCESARVKSGDTLWSLAYHCYGSGAKYTKILRSNRALIRNPRLIYPDQRLAVPR